MRRASRSVLGWVLGAGALAVAPGLLPALFGVAPGCGNTASTATWNGPDGAPGGGSGGSSGGSAPTGSTGPGSTPDASSASTGGDSGGTTGESGGSGRDAGATTADSGGVDGGSSPGTGGCGATTLPMPSATVDAGNGRTLPLELFTINVGGTSREFLVGLPTNYDSNTKYPVVFGWHGAGGTDTQVAVGGVSSFDVFGGFYGLRYQSNQSNKPMIFVAGQGLNPNDAGTGWPNTNGQDVAFTQQMVSWLSASFCVDPKRIYSVGMSYGGIMSNTLGCAMGDVFRAITPMSGLGPGGFGRAPSCKGQVAVWLAHGTQDMTVAFDAGQASRDFWAKANHCSTTTQPTTPAQCVAYQGCDPGYPVDWCTFDGGHTVVSFEPQGIWTFLQQF